MKKNKNDPCWKNYIQLGTKKKNGKEVPNCVPMKEALSKDADAGDYIRDFQKSDAPQFKGKSKEKRREMAVAAFMASKRNMKEETHSAEKILGSKASQRYKSKDQWISAAKGMGLVVKSPSVDVEGNPNKDFFLMAYDKAGNTKGVWYKKDGVLKEETLVENDMKKVATKLSSSKNPAVKKIVATLNSGKEPSSKDILSLKGSVQDDVIQAFAEVIGPEETMKKFNIKEEESHD